MSNFSRLFLIGSIHTCRATIKAWMNSNFCQIGPLTTELAALECLKMTWGGGGGGGGNGVSVLACSLLIKSSPKLLVTMTGIRA